MIDVISGIERQLLSCTIRVLSTYYVLITYRNQTLAQYTGDDEVSEKAQHFASPHNTLADLHQNWHASSRRGLPPVMHNFITVDLGVSTSLHIGLIFLSSGDD